MVSIREWVQSCYQVIGNQVEFINVNQDMEQRNYFSFYNYEYYLDASRQYEILEETMPLSQGLKEAFEWYKNHSDQVDKKPYFEYIYNNCFK